MEAIKLLQILLQIYGVCCLIYSGYYIFMMIFAVHRAPQYLHRAPKCRFAVVCAARNEETVIGELVRSLKAQDYPQDMYEIFVVPNNCTDHTAEAAEQAGAQLLDCAFPVKSKGDVLRQVIAMLSARDDYDAVVVFDADNVVDPGFLSAMNDAWCSGARAAQGYRDSKNPGDSTISGCYSLYYWMVNRFFNHARSAAGLSAMVNGSGFMADLGLLREMGGWKTETMTEDIEFTIQCALRGEKVHWVPQARTYDEQPLTFGQSWHQRSRWSVGVYQNVSNNGGALVHKLLRTGNRTALDLLFFMVAPYMQIGWLVFTGIDVLILMMLHHLDLLIGSAVLQVFIGALILPLVCSTFLALMVLVLERKPLRTVLRGTIAYWLFILSWLPINLVCLVRRDTTWKPIAHTRKISLADIDHK